jgi:hypothetical protein
MRGLDHAGLFLKRLPKIRIFRLIDDAKFGGRQHNSVNRVHIPLLATVLDIFFEAVSSV